MGVFKQGPGNCTGVLIYKGPILESNRPSVAQASPTYLCPLDISHCQHLDGSRLLREPSRFVSSFSGLNPSDC